MNIDKAIENLQQELELGGPTIADKELDEALKLGIEALKRVKFQRAEWRLNATFLSLPGETED